MTDEQIDALINKHITELLDIEHRTTHSDASLSVQLNREALRALVREAAEHG